MANGNFKGATTGKTAGSISCISHRHFVSIYGVWSYLFSWSIYGSVGMRIASKKAFIPAEPLFLDYRRGDDTFQLLVRKMFADLLGTGVIEALYGKSGLPKQLSMAPMFLRIFSSLWGLCCQTIFSIDSDRSMVLCPLFALMWNRYNTSQPSLAPRQAARAFFIPDLKLRNTPGTWRTISRYESIASEIFA